ncbi:Alpha/Beta hydrolase protein [Lasiosphaeria ovina]|uniref:Carboxypeptidase n=1 Tax=Lasiosphaeria ovina TaxID=92902 RepID=A0AAE0TYT6_9PEZI|nr:Alpha/Beta hydrolase protein [Lasiosphaeria ovina]
MLSSRPCSLGLSLLLVWVLLFLAPRHCLAQFAPYATNLTTVVSPVDPRIKISFKDPKGACTTAFDTQQQYTGWAEVPTPDFPTHLFFWFVAAREPTSALTIWLNGGPGSSSMFGFFTEMGPCEVVERGANRLDTVAREWGWDRASNMLFIDQPNQVGFSYDTPANASLDLTSGYAYRPPRDVPSDSSPWLFLNGTLPSNSASKTANTTEIAAVAVWHMLQGFLSVFPQYNPPGASALGVNLFAESYGGKYGPVFADVWEQQNDLALQSGASSSNSPANSTLVIHLTALGIVNGCVDDLVQGPYYAAMTVNSSYGLNIISPVAAALANGSFYESGGCRDAIIACRNMIANDRAPNADASPVQNVSTNGVCFHATSVCNGLLEPYSTSGRSFYDIAHQTPESFPPSYYIEYLNTRAVQDAIGAVVNYTDTSRAVARAFQSTGDYERDDTVTKLAALVARGVRVGLMYGDRDYICNWLGGEAVSLAIAAGVGGAYAAAFPAAGYAPIIVNDSYIGGVVRQFANLSFSRIYQAGHFVPAYQPETAFQVFARIILGTSLSTGSPADLTTYNTTGPANATSSLSLPPSPTETCYVRAPDSCATDSVQSLLKGQGVVVNGVWYAASSDWPGASLTSSAPGASGSGATPTPSASTSVTLTGVFTATSTPNSNSATAVGACGWAGERMILTVLVCMGALFVG